MIPPSKLPEFSKAYFDMFVRYDNGAGRVFMDRRDTQVRQADPASRLLMPICFLFALCIGDLAVFLLRAIG